MDEATQEDMRIEFSQLKQKAAALVAEHWPAITRVAKALVNHDRIDQAEVDFPLGEKDRAGHEHGQSKTRRVG
jgi:hypothetical protein